MNLILKYRRSLSSIGHLIVFALSLSAAFLLRFDLRMPPDQIPLLVKGLCILIPVKLAVFYYAGVTRGWWRYIELMDLIRLLYANLIGSAMFTVLAAVIIGPTFPRTVYFNDLLLCFIGTAACRCSVRLYCEAATPKSSSGASNVLLYGAGLAGATLIREIRSNPSLGYKIVGLLDDDAAKVGMVLMGIPILGGGRDAAAS
jgi:FlaA1/EpsC-like NDP-sugar epimerase